MDFTLILSRVGSGEDGGALAETLRKWKLWPSVHWAHNIACSRASRGEEQIEQKEQCNEM